MPQYITESTQLQCDKGASPSTLSVTSQSFIQIDGKLQATEDDKQANTNIKPFGRCSVTNSSCSPAPVQWQNTSVFDIDGKKELLDHSTCQCSIGGKISVIKSAQSFVEEAGKSIYKDSIIDEEENNKNDSDGEIKDIYISKVDASVFINYGKKDGDIRMIGNGDWKSSLEMTGKEKVEFLLGNSQVVSVDDIQIQAKLQEIHANTKNIEHQIYIYLDRETAKIKSVVGSEGIDGKTSIDSHRMRDKDGKVIGESIIQVGDAKGALLGQAHTHNLKSKEIDNSISVGTKIGGEEEVNDFGTSDIDKETAKALNINVYALDSWNYSSKNAEVSIGRVTPKGKTDKSIGKTWGKGDGKKTINIGLESLNARVGR